MYRPTRYFISFLVLVSMVILVVGTTNCGSKSSQRASSSDQWFSGGTLHQATAAEWIEGTHANKLATASDWLSGTIWKGHLNSLNDFDRLKIKSEMLVSGIDEVIDGNPAAPLKPMEIAASIIATANDLGP